MRLSTHTCQNGYHQKEHNKCWWECGEKGGLINSYWECTLVQPTVWRFLKTKSKTYHMIQQFQLLVYILPKNKKTNLKRYMHPSVQSCIIYNCQDTEATYVFISRWMGKDVVYVYTMGFYSAIKKNEILLFTR